ncbi:hypothetical protein LJR296_006890 [Cupriavidus necator]|uniref:hypothetical protein n=1 Tax=Cupriavidus necator TaxID=106590 RepID=UPI003ECCF1AD
MLGNGDLPGSPGGFNVQKEVRHGIHDLVGQTHRVSETVHLKPCVDDDPKKGKEIRIAKTAVDCDFSVVPAVEDRFAFAGAAGARRNACQAIL